MVLVDKDKPAVLSDLENTRSNISYGCKGKKQDGKTGERGLRVRTSTDKAFWKSGINILSITSEYIKNARVCSSC